MTSPIITARSDAMALRRGSSNELDDVPDPASPEAKRKRITRVACNFCRQRKSGCDGARPQCSLCVRREVQCIYDTDEGEETRRMAREREMKELRQQHDTTFLRMEHMDEGLRVFKAASDERAYELFDFLRSADDPSAAVLSMRDGHPRSPHLSNRPLDKASLLGNRTNLEHELQTRFPSSYPILDPLPMKRLVPQLLRSQNTGLGTSSISISVRSNTSEDGHSSSSVLVNQESHGPPGRPEVCDTRLRQLMIGHWTRVEISSWQAAQLISRYLETDHPILGWFDADLFIADLIHQREDFCSSLLVNSVIFWACQTYCTVEKQMSALSRTFFVEASRLWEETASHDSLNAIAASGILSLGCLCVGNDVLAKGFMLDGCRMAERMGLFDEHPKLGNDQGQTAAPAHRLRASSHVAWGLFNWMVFYTTYYSGLRIDRAPLLPIPGDHSSFQDTGFPPHSQPKYMGRTFASLCKFRRIQSEAVITFYAQERRRQGEGQLVFAERIYHELLEWANGLSTSESRQGHCPHHVAILHIWYHAAVMDLFRPFLSLQLKLTTFDTLDSTPHAAYAASLTQLKRLALTYRSTYPSAAYSILWHVSLLYVANAVLRDFQDDGSRFYLDLCIVAYADLTTCFCIAAGILQGILYIAISRNLVTIAQVQAIRAELLQASQHHPMFNKFRSTHVVDLDLAITDRRGAEVEAMTAKLDNVVGIDRLVK